MRFIRRNASKDTQIKVVHQVNRGLSAARNVGLDMMTGDIVAFSDPDDAFCLDMIERMVEGMLRSQADVVVCGYSSYRTKRRMNRSCDLRRSVYSQEKMLSSHEALVSLVNNKFSVVVWNKLYKKKIWKDIRFPEGCVYEDWWTMYKILERSEKILIMSSVLVRYRIRCDSITHTKTIKNKSDRVQARLNLERFVNENIPEIFSEELRDKFRITQLRETIFLSARILFHLTQENKVLQKKLHNEIVSRKSELIGEHANIKNRVLYGLYVFCPRAIPIIRFFYVRLKSVKTIFRKVHYIDK